MNSSLNPNRHATHSFELVSCIELCEVLGKRVADMPRFLEFIDDIPSDSICYHAHSYLRLSYTHTLYPNDFATWAAFHAHDRVLEERLGVLDHFSYPNLEALRQDIVDIIDDHLSHSPFVYRVLGTESLDFVRSSVIEAPLNRQIWTLLEFRHAVQEVEVGALYFHLCEARMRITPTFDDFSLWPRSPDGLDLPELSVQVEQIVRLSLNLEGMLTRIVALCDSVLERAV